MKNSRVIPLLNFYLKKDRIKLFLMMIGTVSFFVFLAPVLGNMIDDGQSTVIIETMKNPAMIGIVGPVFVDDSYTIGSIYGNYMLLYSGLLIGALNIFLVNSNMRKIEEDGTLELMFSKDGQRLSNSFAVGIESTILNFGIGIFTALGLFLITKGEMELYPSLLYGLNLFAIGMVFAGMTMVLCEITKSGGKVLSLAFLLMFIFYGLRGYGDIHENIFSYISPLGLLLQSRLFVNNLFFPIALLLLEGMVLIAVSLILKNHRDLGSGLIGERKGREKSSIFLNGTFAFVLSLLKKPILIWGLVLFSFAGMYGSVFGDLEKYIESVDFIQKMLSIEGDHHLTNQFITMLMAVMSMISTIAIISFMNKCSSEEKNHYTEYYLAKPVKRTWYLTSFVVISLFVSLLFQTLIALGFYFVGSYYLSEIMPLKDFLIAAYFYLPGILVMIGISTILIGISPKLTFLNYLYLGYSFLLIYFGRLFDLSRAVRQSTPFGHIVQYPIEELSFQKSIVLCTIGLVLIVIGEILYKHRDLE